MEERAPRRHIHRLKESEIDVLQSMVGESIIQIHSPGIIANVESKVIECHGISVALGEDPVNFVNLETDYVLTEGSTDFHYFSISRDEEPKNIEYKPIGEFEDSDARYMAIHAHATVHFDAWNEIEKIEILELSESVQDAKSDVTVETIEYDWGINFYCSATSFSLSTTHQSIVPAILFKDSILEPRLINEEVQYFTVKSRLFLS